MQREVKDPWVQDEDEGSEPILLIVPPGVEGYVDRVMPVDPLRTGRAADAEAIISLAQRHYETFMAEQVTNAMEHIRLSSTALIAME